MQTQTVSYEADGLQMQGHLAFDPAHTGKRPGILVFPEVFGLGDHAKSRAERLASLGYIAMGGDLHGGQKMASGLEEAMGLIADLRPNPGKIRARTEGALAALLAQPNVDPTRIAAIGYCFGGTMALELARAGGRRACDRRVP